MATVDALVIKLDADAKALDQALGRSQKSVKSFSKTVSRETAQAARNMAKLGAAAAAAGAAMTVHAVRSAIDAADSFQKLAIRLGASTEALSQYEHVAQLSGVTFDKFINGLDKMQKSISEAKLGIGTGARALKELGIAVKDIHDLAPEDQFELLADALAGVQNRADKSRLAMDLFGRTGAQLLDILENGSDGIRKMRQEADRLGLTITREMADKAALANDEITRMNASWKRFSNQIAPAVAGAVAQIGEAMRRAAEDGGNLRAIWVGMGGAMVEALGLEYSASALAEQIETRRLVTINKLNDQILGLTNTVNAYKNAIAKTGDTAAPAEIQALNTGLEQAEQRLQSVRDKLDAVLGKNQGDNTPAADGDKPQVTAAIEHQATTTAKLTKATEDLTEESDEMSLAMDLIEQQFRALDMAEARRIAGLEQHAAAVDKVKTKTEELAEAPEPVEDAWQSLGATFESALENALVNGGKVSDILKALEQDILRIFTRKAITEPLAGALSGAFSDFNLGSLFSFEGGGFTGYGPRAGGLDGRGGMPAIVHPNETVIDHTKGQGGSPVVVNMTINTPDAGSFRKSQRQIAADMRAAFTGAR